MADETVVKPGAAVVPRAVLGADEVRAFAVRAPRALISVGVPCVPAGASRAQPFEAELVNLSSSGMFLASARLLEVGTVVEFAFKLDDGLLALPGTAEVVRHAPEDAVGMGLRFVTLDEPARELVARLVSESLATSRPQAETTEGARAWASPVSYAHGSVRVELSPATKPYFTRSPLLHIGVGGCFLPAEKDVPLGTGYQLDIVDTAGRLLLRCKAKVAAKQARQLGLRLVDVDRAALQALRGELAKLPAGD
jgi:PilZ domain